MIETVLDYLLILWALPSLITMLLLIRTSRRYKAQPLDPSDYDLEEWGVCIALSVLYPAGLWLSLIESIDREK